MKKAVIYARYSSERQTEQSIEGQLRVCHEFADAENIKIVHEYIDRAVSGTTDHRPQFQKMINDSKHLDVDYIIVYKLDRFARNRYDSAVYKAKLKQNGIRLLSAMEKITDSPEGIIMEGLLEAMNEYYSAELSQKIRRGIRENVIKGKTIGGNLALGYRIGADKRIEIDPEQAAIVRKIFEMYAQGQTYTEIISYLNDSGYRTSRGNPFNKNSIGRILSNERYIGKYTVSGIEEVSECPRIVSDELFTQVQQLLGVSKSKHRHRNFHNYLLTGVLHCGECGGRMRGTGGKSKTGTRYFYYKCEHKDSKRMNADRLEKLVLQTIDDYLKADKIKTIAKIAFSEYEKQILDTSEKETVSKELKSVEIRLKNAVNAVLNGVCSDAIKETLAELENRKAVLTEKLEDLNQLAPALTLEMFDAGLKNLVRTPTASLVNTCIKRIDLYNDYMMVYFRLFDINGTPPEMIRVEYNVVDEPPPTTLYSNGYVILCLPFRAAASR